MRVNRKPLNGFAFRWAKCEEGRNGDGRVGFLGGMVKIARGFFEAQLKKRSSDCMDLHFAGRNALKD